MEDISTRNPLDTFLKPAYGSAICEASYYKEYNQVEYILTSATVNGKTYTPKKTGVVAVHGTDKIETARRWKRKVSSWLKSIGLGSVYLQGMNVSPVLVMKKALSLQEQEKHLDNECPHAWTNKRNKTIKVQDKYLGTKKVINEYDDLVDKNLYSYKTYTRAEVRQDTALHYRNCGTPLDKATCDRLNAIRTVRKTKQIEVNNSKLTLDKENRVLIPKK